MLPLHAPAPSAALAAERWPATPPTSLKSVVRGARHRAARAVDANGPHGPPRAPEVVPLLKPRGAPLGLRVLLEPQAGRAGATVLAVDPHGLAWRARLRPGDVIEALVDARGAVTRIADGRDATALIPAAHGRLALHVRRREWSRRDAAAATIAACWAGFLTRAELGGRGDEATGAPPWAEWERRRDRASPVRSPPRLSVGDDDEW
jgi:hypothetical protein